MKLKRDVTKHELIADFIFFTSSALIALLVIFLFDIHWSFYPGNTIFPPSKFIGISRSFYIIGSLLWGVIGLFVIKLIMFGFFEEEKVYKRKSS